MKAAAIRLRETAQTFTSRVHSERALQVALMVGALLLLLDLAFIAAHIAFRLGWIDTDGVNVEREESVPDRYQHLKILAIAGLFAVGLVLRRRAIYLAGLFVFGYFLLDDALEVHEAFGDWSADAWSLPAVAGLRPIDLGEIIWAAFVLVVLIGVLAWTWRGAISAEHRFLLRLGLVIVAFAAFALGVDMVHIAAEELGFHRTAYVFGTLEDGGELICMTFAAVVVLHYLITAGRAPSDA